jgi:hypothetical protein
MNALQCLVLLNQTLTKEDLLEGRFHVSGLRNRFVKPALPKTSVDLHLLRALQIADTSFCYPESRSVAESAKLGQEIASVNEATGENLDYSHSR